MNIDEWPRWKLALLVNMATAIVFAIGVSWKSAKEMEYGVRAGVFILAFTNFMFFVVRPKLLAARTTGSHVSPVQLSFDAIREQPFVSALSVLLLVGASRSAAAVVTFATSSGSAYVRSLPNASTIATRMIAMSLVMTVIAMFWFVDAVGLWARRRWAWWLGLILNGRAAALTVVGQVLNPHIYLIDAFAVAAVILLLLPQVRGAYRQRASQ